MDDKGIPLPSEFETVDSLLRWRAEWHPTSPLFTYLLDGETLEQTYTYEEIDRRAKSLASYLQQNHAEGRPVLLVYPSILEYLVAFFGCLYAGSIAVPVHPPRRHHVERLCRIAEDAGARIALTTSDLLEKMEPYISGSPLLDRVQWHTSDTIQDEHAASWRQPETDRESIAFLQYTSGSTGTPKGVMVSHENLLHNQALICDAFQQTGEIVMVGWLPFHHDMGLIGNVLHPVYHGGHFAFMTPISFLQKPLRWLRAISKFRATISGGPNFAYDLCAARISDEEISTLDLSSWEVAFNGAEPVRDDTLVKFNERFRRAGFKSSSFCPCYGMAETTLLITGSKPGVVYSVAQKQSGGLDARFVGCGIAHQSVDIRIVDPQKTVECEPGTVGEIWVSSKSVAAGYWRNSAATSESFEAKLPVNEVAAGRNYFRTGDLGFLHDQELYITGRIKDLIIVRGVNYYPQDIEFTASECNPALNKGGSAAFDACDDGKDHVVIIQELRRSHVREQNHDQILADIRAAVLDEHELPLQAVVLVRPGAVPKTTSGKTQRSESRRMYLDREFRQIAAWHIDDGNQRKPDVESAKATIRNGNGLVEELEQLMVSRLTEWLELETDTIQANHSFSDYAVDSVTAVRLGLALEEKLGFLIEPTVMFDYPTIAALSQHLAGTPTHPTPHTDP